MLIGFPEWIVYSAMVPPLVLTAVIAIAQAVRGFPPPPRVRCAGALTRSRPPRGALPSSGRAAARDAARDHRRDLRRHAAADGVADADRDRDVRRRLARLRRPGRLAAVRELPQRPGVRALRQLRPVGDPALHPDGQLRLAGRHLEVAVRVRELGDGALSRRPGDGRRARLGRVRRDLRLVGGDGGDDHLGRAARDAPPRLLGAPRHRHARRGRHARHPDPAVGAARHLRDPRRAEHRQAVRRGDGARHHRDGRLHDRDRDLRPSRSGPGARGRRRPPADEPACARRHPADRDHLRHRLRRHLRRPVHADRRRRGRRRRDLRRRAAQARDHLGEVQALLLRDRGSVGDDLPDLHRRRPDELGAGADAGAGAARQRRQAAWACRR